MLFLDAVGGIADTGITWGAVGMTITIIATIGLPLMAFVWQQGKKTGRMEKTDQTLEEGVLANKLAIEATKKAHKSEMEGIKRSQKERDLRLYSKIDELKDGVATCNAGIAEIKGYEQGKQQKE